MSDQLPSQQPEDIKRYRAPRHLRTVGVVVAALAVGVALFDPALGRAARAALLPPPRQRRDESRCEHDERGEEGGGHGFTWKSGSRRRHRPPPAPGAPPKNGK